MLYTHALLFLFFSLIALAENQVITLFVHGISDSHKQAEPFKEIIPNLHALNFDCARSYGSWPFNMIYTCSLGQGHELEHMHRELEMLRKNFPQAKFAFIGASRGASAIFNYLATYKPEDIKGVVLESPFDAIEHVVDYRAHRYGIKDAYEYANACIPAVVKEWTPDCIKEYMHYRSIVPWLFWRFSYDGIQPYKVVDQLKKDLPILFVTVENDHSVPAQSTINLIEMLMQAGHTNVHHKHLMQGRHGKLLAGPDADQYKEALRSFFQKYVL